MATLGVVINKMSNEAKCKFFAKFLLADSKYFVALEEIAFFSLLKDSFQSTNNIGYTAKHICINCGSTTNLDAVAFEPIKHKCPACVPSTHNFTSENWTRLSYLRDIAFSYNHFIPNNSLATIINEYLTYAKKYSILDSSKG